MLNVLLPFLYFKTEVRNLLIVLQFIPVVQTLA
jgi:hypothetical protein